MGGTTGGDDARRFVGTWRLVSFTQGNGSVIPERGPHPTGLIHYDATGHMAAQIMPDRLRAAYAGPLPTPVEAQGAVVGYTAYFGTYTVDARARTVTHHREGNVIPSAPAEVVRRYEFLTDDRVAFTAAENSTRLIWERVR
jgi:hypothetical protein